MSVALPIFGDETTRVPPPHAPAEAHGPDRLIDSHGRTIHDLRLSITDRCNYRCVYCMDSDFRYMPKMQLLSLEEYIRVVRVCRNLGITKVRITGGEPTLYPQLGALIQALGHMNIPDLAMTSNGSLFDRLPLKEWREHGLHRITLSLDSLKPERVQAITRTSSTADAVIRAIRRAKETGFDPIKVNAVIMRGINDDEVADFAGFAREHDIDMRLIEFMPLDSSRAWKRSDVFGADEMLERIQERYELVRDEEDDPSSTSMNFSFADGSPGRIGIIAPVTKPFCGACSRLRVTADGKVRPCLFSLAEWDLKPLLRDGATDKDVQSFLVDSMWTKQAGHGIGSKKFIQPQRTMSAIGG